MTLQIVSRDFTRSSDILLSLLKSLFICLFTFRTFWNFLEPFEMFTSLVFPLLVVPVPNSTLENDCILNLHWMGSKRSGIVDSCCYQSKNIEACCCNSLGFDYYSGLSLRKHPHTVAGQQNCFGFLDSRCS